MGVINFRCAIFIDSFNVDGVQTVEIVAAFRTILLIQSTPLTTGERRLMIN
jgi:hypothetical protein